MGLDTVASGLPCDDFNMDLPLHGDQLDAKDDAFIAKAVARGIYGKYGRLVMIFARIERGELSLEDGTPNLRHTARPERLKGFR